MNEDRKKARHRSPAYPSVDLRTAIEKAEVIYKHEKRHSAPVSVVINHCGYEASSSGGLRVVAALKQFGLLLEEGNNDDREVKLSELALDILIADGEESPSRLKAVKVAALSPALHRKIWDKYGGNLPSKPTLRTFLVREMDFNDAHVDKFIRQLSQTVSYARLDEPDTIEAEDDELETEDTSDPSPAFQVRSSRPASSQMTTTFQVPSNTFAPSMGVAAEMVNLPITMPSLRVAWLNVPAKLTKIEFDTLVNTLKMFEAALVQVSSPATTPMRERAIDLGDDAPQ